jgi:hypothetical protein
MMLKLSEVSKKTEWYRYKEPSTSPSMSSICSPGFLVCMDALLPRRVKIVFFRMYLVLAEVFCRYMLAASFKGGVAMMKSEAPASTYKYKRSWDRYKLIEFPIK